MKNIDKAWKEIVYTSGDHQLDINALRGIAENKYAAIVLKNFLDENIIDTTIQVIQRNIDRAIVTQYSNGTLTTIGSYLAKYLNQPDKYFREAQANSSLFPMQFDISIYVREKLQHIFNLHSLKIAREPDGRTYAPFIVRIHSDGIMNPLHNDNIMRDAKSTDLLVAKLKYQLSCIICIQECDTGGNLRHYMKSWNPDDEKYKIKNGIGYDYEVVKEKPCFVFKPKVSDIYLINPTNYHEIDRVSGQTRITVGFFIGFFDDELKNGIVWS
jgi:hypothetical protein